uniref:Uncharacterized protein n=1 Tax=Paramormyrops kingsleyae TaxID=1676925 RepID=A0A3B3QJ99_9TELE
RRVFHSHMQQIKMAFKGKVADTKTVVLHLILCLVIFYTLYYMIGSICFGAFSNFSFTKLTFLSSGLLFAAVVRRWVWDYALTVTLLHVLLTSVATTNWQWWDLNPRLQRDWSLNPAP